MIVDIGRRIKRRKIFEKGIHSFCRGEEKWRRKRGKICGEGEYFLRRRRKKKKGKRKLFGDRKYPLVQEKKNIGGKGGKYLEKEKLLRDGWTDGWVEGSIRGLRGPKNINVLINIFERIESQLFFLLSKFLS